MQKRAERELVGQALACGQRYLREGQAASRHFSFNFDIAWAACGIAVLGGTYAHPTM